MEKPPKKTKIITAIAALGALNASAQTQDPQFHKPLVEHGKSLPEVGRRTNISSKGDTVREYDYLRIVAVITVRHDLNLLSGSDAGQAVTLADTLSERLAPCDDVVGIVVHGQNTPYTTISSVLPTTVVFSPRYSNTVSRISSSSSQSDKSIS